MNVLRRAASQHLRALGARGYASGSGNPERKVAILGAAGGIGQPLSLLMKRGRYITSYACTPEHLAWVRQMNPYITSLALYDVVGTPGVAADVSHINSKAQVKGYTGDAELGAALKDADLVIIPAGVPRKPGMTRDDLFNINAGIVRTLITAAAEHCPKALLNIISNPVNSTVPIAAAVLKAKGVYDPKKLFGVTTLDVVRARTFYAESQSLDVMEVEVPVVGGHAGVTILPLFSQASPFKELSGEKAEALTRRTQDGGTEVVQAKAGKGSATLSMAYAGALFADACLRGLNGEPGVEEYTFVQSTVVPGLPYFSSKVKLGPTGAEHVYDLGDLNDYEKAGLELLKPELKASIDKGTKFADEAT